MSAFRWDLEMHRYSVIVIRIWSWKIVQALRCPDSEREDFAGEIWLDLAIRAQRYDPQRAGRHTFVGVVVRHKALEIIASRKTVKNRHLGRTRSLNAPIGVDDDAFIEEQDLVSADEYADAWRGPGPTTTESRDRHLHVDRCMERITAELRDICQRLMSESVSAVARDLGIPRSKLRAELRKLRPIFEGDDPPRKKSGQIRRRPSK